MCGTDQFHGVGNGDVGNEPALMVNWLKRNGHLRVAVVCPWSPIGEEYFRFFRQKCRRLGLSITATESVTATTPFDDLVTKFAALQRDLVAVTRSQRTHRDRSLRYRVARAAPPSFGGRP